MANKDMLHYRAMSRTKTRNRLTGPVPPVPSGLLPGYARLCPNTLDTTPSGNDAGWNLATGYSPWWAVPYANNNCDDLFSNGFND